MSPDREDPFFDGRSYNTKPLQYSTRERVSILLATKLMPAITYFLFSDRLNTIAWRLLGCKVEEGSVIRRGTSINAPFKLILGKSCSIHGTLKCRGGVVIGDGVEFVEEVFLSTQKHNVDSSSFESIYQPITIDELSWIGPRAIILPGIHISTGTVIAAGAVVTKSTEPWGVYSGIPATLFKFRHEMKRP